MRIHLGGHLSWYDPQKRPWLEITVYELIPLKTLVAQLGIPPGEISLTTINDQQVTLDEGQASNADRIAFYPPLGGG